MSAQAQQAAGITAGMLRLSLGVEDTSDLVADVAAGLDRALAAN
jgi:cystathionine gamma-synthase